MKISMGRRKGEGVVLLKEWTTYSLSRGLVIKLSWQMPIFLLRLLSLTTFLSISVCWFWFRLSKTREAEPGRDGAASHLLILFSPIFAQMSRLAG